MFTLELTHTEFLVLAGCLLAAPAGPREVEEAIDSISNKMLALLGA